jgi:XTP/dITP diphosphohydrolase
MVTTLILATRNLHKAEELRAILSDSAFEPRLLTLRDFPPAPAVAEDAGTFAGNATKKAVVLARWLSESHIPNFKFEMTDSIFALADDSGLEVDALDGAPGVYSARFAALDTGEPGNSSDGANNAKLLRLLKDVPLERRKGRFRCALALTPLIAQAREGASPVCAADELEIETELFEGVCEGRIAFAPSGAGGFGYDPLFIPEGHQQSFAELAEGTKNTLSHRARALSKLKEWFSKRGDVAR